MCERSERAVVTPALHGATKIDMSEPHSPSSKGGSTHQVVFMKDLYIYITLIPCPSDLTVYFFSSDKLI
jgi:hypothetical protein